MVFVVP